MPGHSLVLEGNKQTKANHVLDALALLEAFPCTVWVSMDKSGEAGLFWRRHDEGIGTRQGTSLSDSDANLSL